MSIKHFVTTATFVATNFIFSFVGIHKTSYANFLNFGPLKSWDYLGLKYFLKQISLKGDVNYSCINHEVPIFYEKQLHKSTLKLWKILQFA